MNQVLEDDFMTLGYLPTRLPLSCLTMAPRFDARLNTSIVNTRRPLGEVAKRENIPIISSDLQGVKGDSIPAALPPTAETPFPAVPSGPTPHQLLRDLQQQLNKLFLEKPTEKVPLLMGNENQFLRSVLYRPNNVVIVFVSLPVNFR